MHVIIGSHLISVSNGLKFEVDLPRPSGTVSVHSRFLTFSVFFVLVFIATQLHPLRSRCRYQSCCLTWFTWNLLTKERCACKFRVNNILTNWGWDKMAHIFRCIFVTKMLKCPWKIHQSFFLRVNLIRTQQWFRWWLGGKQERNHHLNQWWPKGIAWPQWVN